MISRQKRLARDGAACPGYFSFWGSGLGVDNSDGVCRAVLRRGWLAGCVGFSTSELVTLKLLVEG